MHRQKAGVLFLWISLLCLPGAAHAQTGLFFDEFGAGYKATAMGQAFTAVADDYSAAYYNPAGLTQIKSIFENNTGYIYGKPLVRAHFPGNEALDIDGQPCSRGLFTGIASSLDIEQTVRVFPWFKRFAFGLVSWLNLPEITQYHAGPIPSRPHFLRQDMRFQLLAMAISLGFEITPWLSIGAGIIPSIDSTADQDNFSAVNKYGDVIMGQRLSIHQTAKLFLVPVVGLLTQPPLPFVKDLKFSIGVSFRDQNMSHNGEGPLNQTIGVEDVYGNPVFAIFYPPVMTINLVSFAPRQVTMGLAMKPAEKIMEALGRRLPIKWTLAYDLTWKQWSQYRTYLETEPFPPFVDTFTQRLGTEVAWYPHWKPRFLNKIGKICFRGGYYFEPTPVQHFELGSPEVDELSRQHVASDNTFDSDLDVFSIGLAITYVTKTMEHELEMYYQYQSLRGYSTAAYIDSVYAYLNDLPTTIRDDYIPVEVGGSVWSIGGAYTMRF